MNSNKEKIKEDLKVAKREGHDCSEPRCLISKVVPIVANLETEKGFDALADVVFFCYDQTRSIHQQGFTLILVDINTRIMIGDVDVKKFQLIFEHIGQLESEIFKNWVFIAQEAGRDEKSIQVLLWLFHFIQAVIEAWKNIKKIRKMKEAILN